MDTAMSLSREIIVLDFGDGSTSPYDFDKPTTSAGGTCKPVSLIQVRDYSFTFSDGLQGGRRQLAGDQRGDLQLRHRDRHLPHQDIRPRPLGRLRHAPRHLHLHHVLLLHEESHSPEPESEFNATKTGRFYLFFQESSLRNATIFRG